MLEDLDYCESIENIIRNEKACAEYAVQQTATNFSQMFVETEDDYLRERAADVMDISRRVIQILMKAQKEAEMFENSVVLAGEDLHRAKRRNSIVIRLWRL